MIPVTKCFLPDFDIYTATLKRAWDKGWITNNGELVQELEQRLKHYLGVKHLFYAANGTVVLEMALKAYNITQEVITTPFSYVATTNAIRWMGAKPIFVDVNKENFCIDATKIESAITERTQAILATHLYGYPCDVEMIESIAMKHQLKVIYDGAHAFGAKYRGRSILSYGDISTCSFHAVKLFHTVEGGCVITNDDSIAEQLMLYRQFGHVGENYFGDGINGKNSEFHAAMGLSIMPNIDDIIANRKAAIALYDRMLDGERFQRPLFTPDFDYNGAYFPIVLESEASLLVTQERLQAQQIFPRRYFYPSLNTLPYISGASCPIAEDITSRVLCLPLFYGISPNEITRIVAIINESN